MDKPNFIKGSIIKERVITGKNGQFSIIALSVKVDEFIEELKRMQTETGWANIDIKKMKTPTDKGVTHYMEENNYKKAEKSFGGFEPPVAKQYPEPKEINVDDIPF